MTTVISARVSGLRSTPSKLNLVADLIRGQNVSTAVMYLKFCRKKAAFLVGKVLKSAVANARANYDVDLDSLYVKEVLVGKSFTLRRVRPRARGRACRIRKRYGSVVIRLLKR
ncbi:50S ribosomal protein L22 [Anaplasma marginale str. Dawn]|uniref:50S ribosomal protein L22 n=1 Tax=Anaplasma marginale TaxID=770 RepID=UPI0003C2697E|nr:50S ribosomal protein L22 [Anaplasma marginale]AGZ79022.1 50S ribosomal protein L22 [Anaplasma marginale str. Gypsy Plains]AGZ79832.1 50S ribosomal protein L22 [Anaplasma marginale str. Dawn]